MTCDGVVLVHGAYHGGWVWDGLHPLLDVPSVAPDLPGRGADDRPLDSLALADFVDAVVEAVEGSGFQRAMLVGHSMAGVVVPAAAQRVAERLGHLVCIACSIPPPGRSQLDLVPRPFRRFARPGDPLPLSRARRSLANDMTREQADWLLEGLGAEAPRLFTDPTPDWSLPADLARTYVVLTKDRALPPFVQRRRGRRLGPETRFMRVRAGHDAMVSRPEAVAGLLNPLL